MKNKTVLLGMFIAVALPLHSRAAVRPDAPNIVFILADDLGWRDLGCYGSTFYQTPNIDALAARGMRFTDAYAACPVCSPSRAGILTGKYPARLGLTDWLPGQANVPWHKLLSPPIPDHLALEEITLSEAFKDAGFVTGFFGKWHLGGRQFYPQLQGFDVNFGGCEMGSPRSYFSPYHIPTLRDGPVGEYLTDRLTDEAIAFMESNREKPFVLYLSHYAVHIPLQAKAEDVERCKERATALPHSAAPKIVGGTRQVQDHPVYAAMVESVDQSVGRVFGKLEELGLTSKTLVILTSDNGGLSTAEGSPTSNLPLRGGKGWLYEGGIREPLIAVWPNVIPAGSISHDLTIGTDFYPTLLEAAGLPLRPQQHQDGTSILPVLRGKHASAERSLFWHYPHYSNQGGGPGAAIRMGSYKLIEWFETGEIELFDLAEDPGERQVLTESQSNRAADLSRRLHEWQTSVGAKMPQPNPNYQPEPVHTKPSSSRPNTQADD